MIHPAAHIRQLADAFIARTASDTLLALSEGFIKVRLMESALDLGYILQEGACLGFKYGAHFVKKRNSTLQWTQGKRLLLTPEGSADISIVQPLPLQLEIKARPDHGTKSQAQFQQMIADVDRVAADPQYAFFFLFESSAYTSFSSERHKAPPRLSEGGAWFNTTFPKRGSLLLDDWIGFPAKRGGNTLLLQFHYTSVTNTILALGTKDS